MIPSCVARERSSLLLQEMKKKRAIRWIYRKWSYIRDMRTLKSNLLIRLRHLIPRIGIMETNTKQYGSIDSKYLSAKDGEIIYRQSLHIISLKENKTSNIAKPKYSLSKHKIRLQRHNIVFYIKLPLKAQKVFWDINLSPKTQQSFKTQFGFRDITLSFEK